MREIQFLTVEAKPGVKSAKWERSAGIDVKTGDVFVPAFMAGHEQRVFLCASYDGEPAVTWANHMYLRTSWMKMEYPFTRELCEKIEAKMAEAFKVDSCN